MRQSGFSEESLEDHRKIVEELKAEFPDGPQDRKRKKRGVPA